MSIIDTKYKKESISSFTEIYYDDFLAVSRTFSDKSANYTILEDECKNNFVFTNIGSSGTIKFELPTPVVGYRTIIIVVESQTIQVDSGSSNKIYTTSASSGSQEVECSTKGGVLELFCINSSEWMTKDVKTWSTVT